MADAGPERRLCRSRSQFDGEDVSIDGSGDTFYAVRLSRTGLCFGIRDVGAADTTYNAFPLSLSNVDNLKPKPWDPAWPEA